MADRPSMASSPEPAAARAMSPSSDDTKSKSTSPPSNSDSSAPRNKRRSHKKSRAGCENCKVRRVKCDETQPKCRKCSDYGIECSYGSTSAGLHFAGEGSFAVEKPVKQLGPVQPGSLMLSTLAKHSGPMPMLRDLEPRFSTQRWVGAEMDILTKFQERTVLTVGAKGAGEIYKNEVFKLAMHYPFLTHVVLTLTLLHDRHLTGDITIGERAALHWYRGTTLFQEALVKPEKQSQRDALWASAAMLGCIQFAAIEARSPEEAWPLKAPSHEDLDWLKMSDGKKAVWKICNADGDKSIFSKMRGHPDVYKPMVFTGHEMANVTREFCELFDLGPSSSAEENPYHSAAMALARLLPLECDSSTVLDFLSWMTQIHPKLKTLLLDREPKALLLVAFWFAKLYHYQWWVYRRGLLEGQAICIYLDRYYSHATSIQSLLRYPKMAFGLSFSPNGARALQMVMPIRQAATVTG